MNLKILAVIYVTENTSTIDSYMFNIFCISENYVKSYFTLFLNIMNMYSLHRKTIYNNYIFSRISAVHEIRNSTFSFQPIIRSI